MKVVVTGGAGFLGSRLIRHLLREGSLTDTAGEMCPIDEVLVLDRYPPSEPRDQRVHALTGDLADPALVDAAIDARTRSVFHLAAVVSGQAEADFELGMGVNFDGTRHLLDACRRLPHAPRVVFASSVAVFGGELPAIVPDDLAPNPQSSYGTQKVAGELLVNDYSRRGFIDGRSVRLPTIVVRPGKPNRAASSFASGIVREPLAGLETECPVDGGTRLWLLSPSKAIDGLIRAHDLTASALGTNRTLNLPGLSVTVAEMLAALEGVAGRAAVERVRWVPDAAVARIVGSWPGDFAPTRALSLGFSADADFEHIIRAYLEDETRST